MLPLLGRPPAKAEEGTPEVGVRGWLEVDDVGLLLPVLAVRADAPRKRAFLGDVSGEGGARQDAQKKVRKW